MARTDIEARLVEGRDCGACTLCCRVLGVGEFSKPPGDACPNCVEGSGCVIYQSRPGQCRDFYCGFLLMKDLGEEWRPATSKLILVFDGAENRVRVHVDLQHPDAWRKEPYYSKLKQWAVVAAPHRTQIIVRIGDRVFAILPDRDIDLGVLGEDDVIVTEDASGAEGGALNILKLPSSDPRARTLSRPSPWMTPDG